MKKYICLPLLILLTISLNTGCSKKNILTFDSQGGSEVASIEIITGNPITLPAAPTKANAFFAGWFTSLNGKGAEVKDGAYYTSSAKLYAYWVDSESDLAQTKKITVTFNANGGQCDTSEAQILPGTSLKTIPEPTRDNYSFAGWYTSKSADDVTAVITTEKTFNENTMIYANWRRIWTLKFSAPDAKNKEVLTSIKVLDNGIPVGLPIPERDGYKFVYWYSTSSDTQTEVKSDFLITKDYTLYAQWEVQ